MPWRRTGLSLSELPRRRTGLPRAELPRRVHADEAGRHALLELLDLESKLLHAVTSSLSSLLVARYPRTAVAASTSIGFSVFRDLTMQVRYPHAPSPPPKKERRSPRKIP